MWYGMILLCLVRYNGLGCGGMRLDGIAWHGMAWYGMARYAMGLDAIAWHGMVWSGIVYMINSSTSYRGGGGGIFDIQCLVYPICIIV